MIDSIPLSSITITTIPFFVASGVFDPRPILRADGWIDRPPPSTRIAFIIKIHQHMNSALGYLLFSYQQVEFSVASLPDVLTEFQFTEKEKG